ncbi:hypothetical protein ASPSYDRAFT_37860 [Aspergillus sydowii CBS 593.65]|uniref:Uncharacterized protein n=1 Tax=Aspergillus sydowii CBS 593.65 TaxID=1036612 RepID=A0A1L9TV65_9EURO|nr:uncharacterized protein ASPSYDRAFT_37860 [Aspergillus sydowii CBS 593.65]OJJ63324.1 hypothetical protein ASPSYDRAFT_37860 [Aspergillus sydowii CBS 593.65]
MDGVINMLGTALPLLNAQSGRASEVMITGSWETKTSLGPICGRFDVSGNLCSVWQRGRPISGLPLFAPILSQFWASRQSSP